MDGFKPYINKLFIDGQWVEPINRDNLNKIPVVNPATEEEIARIASAGHEDVDLAVSAARRAFERTG